MCVCVSFEVDLRQYSKQSDNTEQEPTWAISRVLMSSWYLHDVDGSAPTLNVTEGGDSTYFDFAVC